MLTSTSADQFPAPDLVAAGWPKNSSELGYGLFAEAIRLSAKFGGIMKRSVASLVTLDNGKTVQILNLFIFL